MLFAFDITQSVEKGVPYNARDKSVGLPPLSLGVDPRPDHVAFILDKVAMVQVSLRGTSLFLYRCFPLSAPHYFLHLSPTPYFLSN